MGHNPYSNDNKPNNNKLLDNKKDDIKQPEKKISNIIEKTDYFYKPYKSDYNYDLGLKKDFIKPDNKDKFKETKKPDNKDKFKETKKPDKELDINLLEKEYKKYAPPMPDNKNLKKLKEKLINLLSNNKELKKEWKKAYNYNSKILNKGKILKNESNENIANALIEDNIFFPLTQIKEIMDKHTLETVDELENDNTIKEIEEIKNNINNEIIPVPERTSEENKINEPLSKPSDSISQEKKQDYTEFNLEYAANKYGDYGELIEYYKDKIKDLQTEEKKNINNHKIIEDIKEYKTKLLDAIKKDKYDEEDEEGKYEEEDEDGKGKNNNDDKGLYTSQIDQIMSKYRPIYKGAVASDEINNEILPQLNNKSDKVAFVMNIDKHNQPGSHWVAIYLDKGSKQAEYYNSLGDSKTDKIPPHVFKAIIKIINKISPDDVEGWKIKQNSEADQSALSSNCGWFSCKFIIDRIKGVPFKIAAGHGDKSITRGENRINKFKAKYKNIIQGGNGVLGDIYDRAKYFITGPNQRSPNLNNFLKEYGRLKIKQIMICREPVNSIITNLINVASLGQLKENIKKQGYDNIYHLYMLLKMDNKRVIRLEKNQNVQIGFVNSANPKEFIQINANNIPLNFLFENAEKKMPLDKLYRYNPVSSNCQIFLRDMLQSSNLLTDNLNNFIMQDSEKLLEKDGFLNNILEKLTDTASNVSIALTGGKKKKINLIFNNNIINIK
jgi:hypothetical protein